MTFMPHNIFKKIISRDVPADIVYETESVLCFHDINPQAEVHILIIPKQEIKTAKDITENNKAVFAELFLAAKVVSKQFHLSGYKLIMNVDESGGQVVPHVHFHLLSPDYKGVGSTL